MGKLRDDNGVQGMALVWHMLNAEERRRAWSAHIHPRELVILFQYETIQDVFKGGQWPQSMWVIHQLRVVLNLNVIKLPLILSSYSKNKHIAQHSSSSFLYHIHPPPTLDSVLPFLSSPSSPLYHHPSFSLFPALAPWHRSSCCPHLSSCHLFHSSLLPIPLCFVLFKVGLWVSVSVRWWQWWISDSTSVVSDDHKSLLSRLCGGNY